MHSIHLFSPDSFSFTHDSFHFHTWFFYFQVWFIHLILFVLTWFFHDFFISSCTPPSNVINLFSPDSFTFTHDSFNFHTQLFYFWSDSYTRFSNSLVSIFPCTRVIYFHLIPSILHMILFISTSDSSTWFFLYSRDAFTIHLLPHAPPSTPPTWFIYFPHLIFIHESFTCSCTTLRAAAIENESTFSSRRFYNSI